LISAEQLRNLLTLHPKDTIMLTDISITSPSIFIFTAEE
jgi:hypothetical protein